MQVFWPQVLLLDTAHITISHKPFLNGWVFRPIASVMQSTIPNSHSKYGIYRENKACQSRCRSTSWHFHWWKDSKCSRKSWDPFNAIIYAEFIFKIIAIGFMLWIDLTSKWSVELDFVVVMSSFIGLVKQIVMGFDANSIVCYH